MSATNVFNTWIEVAVEISYEFDQDSLVLKSANLNETSVASPDILPALTKQQREELETECAEDFRQKRKEAWDK